MKKGLHIALTITGCKRPYHFESTINSLKDMILDSENINTIIHYDDSSTKEELSFMRNVLESAFPDKMICYRRCDDNSFTTNKRHMEVMNYWLDDLSLMDVDYVLHTEEDWNYLEKFYIMDIISFMKLEHNCAQVGLSQPIRETNEDIKLITKDNYWKWLYLNDRELLENLFLDEVEMSESDIPGYWCYFINWPYFGLRPGIYDFKKIHSIGNFEDNENSFELDFAIRYSKKYVSWCTKKRICKHTGDISSYDLNNSKR